MKFTKMLSVAFFFVFSLSFIANELNAQSKKYLGYVTFRKSTLTEHVVLHGVYKSGTMQVSHTKSRAAKLQIPNTRFLNYTLTKRGNKGKIYLKSGTQYIDVINPYYGGIVLIKCYTYSSGGSGPRPTPSLPSAGTWLNLRDCSGYRPGQRLYPMKVQIIGRLTRGDKGATGQSSFRINKSYNLGLPWQGCVGANDYVKGLKSGVWEIEVRFYNDPPRKYSNVSIRARQKNSVQLNRR